MLSKTIKVGDKEVAFRSSATIPRLYRAKFKRDIFKDLSKLESSYKGNSEAGSSFAIEDLELTMLTTTFRRISTIGLTSLKCSLFTRCFQKFLNSGVQI